ncbi:MAG: PHB depolymerase family esterase [Undibacterium sp.]|nr:PHB depolymerase family esterase [Undibacterium sp.]
MVFRKTVRKLVAPMLLAGLSTSAWALTPGSGTWVNETTLFGLQNAYVYVPKNVSPAIIGTGRALMVSLHGCGMTASNVINKGYNWEATAEQYGMVVIAPTVPSGTTSTRSYAGCWDWFGGNHTRTTRDEAVLLNLVNAVKARTNLDIDPKQIYITGLSSGGGLVNTIACVAPDVFAGAGDNAGPALYTASNAGVGSKATVTAQSVSSNCTQIAGSYSSHLATQIFSVVNGTSDYTVDPTHDQVQTAGMKLNYGASSSNGTFTDVKSTGESWKDAAGKTRVSYVQATGMGHAWPAGAGGSGGGTYVDYTHVNYPAYVTKFFFDNNLRVSRDAAPVMTTCAATAASSSSATISGAATDNGSIASYAVSLTGATAVNDTAAGSAASFSKTYNLASGYYSGTVSATDNLGQVSASCAIAQFLVGSPPAILPPAGLAVVSTTASSAALSWTAVSGASGYNVYRNGSKVTATPATSIAYTDTGLTASTTYSYQVSSIDASSLESSLSASVSGTTKSAWTCSTTSASNYAHVQAGRAHNSAGYALANGSNQNMGLNNLFYISVLAQTSAGYYIKGNCP